MQGKVTMRPLVCYHCGRERLTLAQAPWGARVIICKGCKQITPVEESHIATATVEEAAERGLPKVKAPTSNGQTVPSSETATPQNDPDTAPDPTPTPEPEVGRRPRRRAATE